MPEKKAGSTYQWIDHGSRTFHLERMNGEIMKTIILLAAAMVFAAIGCSPTDDYKPASERQYESADPPAADSTAAPSDSTAASDEEDEDQTEEVILRSL